MSNYREIKEECYEASLSSPEYKLTDLAFGNVDKHFLRKHGVDAYYGQLRGWVCNLRRRQ